MRIRLAADQKLKLLTALGRAGSREIGGQLFGEQLEPSHFVVTELTVQSRPGTFARFFVDLFQAARDAATFFGRTNHWYERFNYIGEWHSHPSFTVQPSGKDLATMRELVRDAAFLGSFAILMIVRLERGEIESKAMLFEPDGSQGTVALEIPHGL